MNAAYKYNKVTMIFNIDYISTMSSHMNKRSYLIFITVVWEVPKTVIVFMQLRKLRLREVS